MLLLRSLTLKIINKGIVTESVWTGSFRRVKRLDEFFWKCYDQFEDYCDRSNNHRPLTFFLYLPKYFIILLYCRSFHFLSSFNNYENHLDILSETFRMDFTYFNIAYSFFDYIRDWIVVHSPILQIVVWSNLLFKLTHIFGHSNPHRISQSEGRGRNGVYLASA